MGSMSTFLRTLFSKNGLKCINFYEEILTKYILLTACLSRVTQYEAAEDRYFHLAASSVPLPFVLPVVPSLSSSSFYPPV